MSTSKTQKSVQELLSTREKLDSTINSLQQKLLETESERNEIDFQIQTIEFDERIKEDPLCIALKKSFEVARGNFENSLKTPKNYESDVPFRCSDDFADTAFFDDWVDRQLEVFRNRFENINSEDEESHEKHHQTSSQLQQQEQQNYNNTKPDFEGAIRILLYTSELIQMMCDAVGKVEGADAGIILECRENVLEHWETVLEDVKSESSPLRSESERSNFIQKEQEEEEPKKLGLSKKNNNNNKKNKVDYSSFKDLMLNSQIGICVKDHLDRLGKPFSSLFEDFA